MDDEYHAALRLALKRLETSDRFESEVRLALSSFPQEIVERVLAYLISKSFLNDARTTRAVVANNHGRRAVGVRKLQGKLEQRGAPSDVVLQTLANVEETEALRAQEVLQSRYGARNVADRAKAGRYLFGRGFEEDVVEASLNRHFGDASEEQ